MSRWTMGRLFPKKKYPLAPPKPRPPPWPNSPRSGGKSWSEPFRSIWKESSIPDRRTTLKPPTPNWSKRIMGASTGKITTSRWNEWPEPTIPGRESGPPLERWPNSWIGNSKTSAIKTLGLRFSKPISKTEHFRSMRSRSKGKNRLLFPILPRDILFKEKEKPSLVAQEGKIALRAQDGEAAAPHLPAILDAQQSRPRSDP